MKTFRPARPLLVPVTILAASIATLVPVAMAQLAPAPQAITAGDAKAFEAADALFQQGKFKEALPLFEKFMETYKMQSPRSLDAKLRLAVTYIQVEQWEQGVKHFRDLIADKKVATPAKELSQMMIAKALTLRAFKLYGSAETEAQKTAQNKAFGEAVKEYEAFLVNYPQSKDMDTAHFLRAQLLFSMESFEDAVKGFMAVARLQSPLRMDAVMWVGKSWFVAGNALLSPAGNKEPKPEDIKTALDYYNRAMDANSPSLVTAYLQSGDIAVQNEATFYIGQMQLARSQHQGEDEAAKAKQAELMQAALDAFRAVRSVEEVVAAQEDKIRRYEQGLQILSGRVSRGEMDPNEYMATKNRLEGLMDLDRQKIDEFKKGVDQYLAARLSIARILLFQKKTDECRVLLRYLAGQTESLEKDKDATPTIASLLTLTYVEQKNAEKALENYEAFRAKHKGHASGDNLPLLVANLLVSKGNMVKAEEIVNQGIADYKDWRFTQDAIRILTAVALDKGDYQKALAHTATVLSATDLKPDVEAETLYLRGTIERAMASEKRDVAIAEKAIATFQVVRDKFPNNPKSEDSWYAICEILVGKSPEKAIEELTKFIEQFSSGTPKSETTAANIPIARYRLAQSLEATQQRDKALEAYRKVVDNHVDSEVAPGALFKMFDTQNGQKNYAEAGKLMNEFIEKYPKHDNVYFAYSNLAEMLFLGVAETKLDPSGKPVPPKPPGIPELTKGTQKLVEFVEYELKNELKQRRGDDALIKATDRWLKYLSTMPPYFTLGEDKKAEWQRAVDQVVSLVEQQLQHYSEDGRMPDGLQRLVNVMQLRMKAQQIDAAKGETYFRGLSDKYAKSNEVKAKILVALGSFLRDSDVAKSRKVIAEGIGMAPESKKDENGKVLPTFGPWDHDRHLEGLFEERKFDDMGKVIARLRSDFPLDEAGDIEHAPLHNNRDAHAIALFWEAKLLGEQGKVTDAGAKFEDLKKRFPKSAKVMEADYGVILGKVEQKQIEPDFIERLGNIVKQTNTRGFELQAKALFLIGRIYETQGEYDNAIDTYIGIHARYESVPEWASKGLWYGSQLLEKQGSGALKVLTAAEQKKVREERAAARRAAAEKKKAEEEKAKPTENKDAKPADKTTAAADA